VACEVAVSGTAARQIAGMPPAARTALADVLGQLAADPWSGAPYDTRRSPEFGTIACGNGGS
jgi:hypothetical protein